MSYLGTQPNDVKKNTGLYTPSEILQLTKEGSWGGSLELIEKKTVSGVSAIDFLDLKGTIYDTHLVEFNVKPSADTQNYIRFSDDGGTSFESSNYQYASFINDSASGSGEIKSNSSSQIYLNYGGGNETVEQHTAYYYFYNLGKAKFSTVSQQAVTGSSTGSVHTFIGGGCYRASDIINGIRFYPQNGNYTGDVSLYGVKQ